LRILVDEDSQARAQLKALRGDSHDVVAVGELGKNGTPDPEVFDLAQSLERVLLTHHTSDFYDLHRERPAHRGIMAVHRDADPRKNHLRAGEVTGWTREYFETFGLYRLRGSVRYPERAFWQENV
jgi:hypothetical protein